MVALILEAARAAREESERLRVDSKGLRLNVRLAVERAHAVGESVTTATRRTREPLPVASPWSTLEWLPGDEALELTLVPVD